jgi:hypothetical protein
MVASSKSQLDEFHFKGGQEDVSDEININTFLSAPPPKVDGQRES